MSDDLRIGDRVRVTWSGRRKDRTGVVRHIAKTGRLVMVDFDYAPRSPVIGGVYRPDRLTKLPPADQDQDATAEGA